MKKLAVLLALTSFCAAGGQSKKNIGASDSVEVKSKAPESQTVSSSEKSEDTFMQNDKSSAVLTNPIYLIQGVFDIRGEFRLGHSWSLTTGLDYVNAGFISASLFTVEGNYTFGEDVFSHSWFISPGMMLATAHVSFLGDSAKATSASLLFSGGYKWVWPKGFYLAIKPGVFLRASGPFYLDIPLGYAF